MRILIALQTWDADKGGYGMPYFNEVKKEAIPDLCYTLAAMMKKQIRLTYPPNRDYDVNRLSGGYYHPLQTA